MSGRKNGYYICYRTNTDFIGVDKKIDNQVKVLNSCCNCQKIAIPREKGNIIKSILWRMPFGSMGRKYEYALDMISKEGKPDFIYIRFAPLDRRFIKFIKDLRVSYPLAKIILEIPAYPYNGELLNNITMFPFYFKDIFYRSQLKKYVDRITTFSDDEEIYGIPTIRIMNGIIVDDVPKVCSEKQEDIINLIAVASFQKHHGYERCITGLKDYYAGDSNRKIKIYLHMVGDGSELKKYKKMTRQYGLEDYVLFYGHRSGEDLNQIYAKADIALGSFGFYKIKLERSSVLKVREYLSRGLPIISACKEDVFQGDSPKFYMHVENEDTAVNMQQVMEFYMSLFSDKTGKAQMAEYIRSYAKKKVDMSIVMKPIITYIFE